MAEASSNGLVSDIELRVGEEYHIRLKGLGTAGYTWDFEVEGDKESIHILREEPSPLPPPTGMWTTSFEDVFRVRAVSIGKAIIRFKQRRSWEKNTQPLNQSIFEVSVKA